MLCIYLPQSEIARKHVRTAIDRGDGSLLEQRSMEEIEAIKRMVRRLRYHHTCLILISRRLGDSAYCLA